MRTKLVIGIWMAGIALAVAAGEFQEVVVAGTSHAEGEARWTDSLARDPSENCSTPGVAKQFTLPLSTNKNGPAVSDCVSNSVVVRNQSARPMHCRASLDLPQPDPASPTHRESSAVIPMGEEKSVTGAIGRAADVPTAFSTQCRIIPAELPPKPEVPPECTPSIRAPSPNDYYPPASRRRSEEGDIAFDYSVDAATKKLVDVWVVGSSGSADLDYAALRYAGAMRVTTACPERRFRMIIRFRVVDSLQPSTN